MRYVEIYATLTKCISKKEIPPHFYEGLKLLNAYKGMTSLVFDKNDGVRIFTKDEVKKDWLLNTLGEYIDVIPGTKYKDIHIIDYPKLYPLSSENKKIVNTICKTINTAPSNSSNLSAVLYTMNKFEDRKIKGNLKMLADFIKRYSNQQKIGLDFSPRNFMQTKSGILVFLDVVADKELIRNFLISKNPMYRYVNF